MSIVESTMTKCQTFFQSLKAEAEQTDSLLQLSLEPSLEKRGRGQLRGRTWSLTWTLAPGGTSLGYFTAHGIQDRRKVWKSGSWGGHNLKALLRPYYTAKRTREILISNIHLLTSVPLKKIVTCIWIHSLCLYYGFYSKFFFHIANSSCQKL